jgi:hypothetical protein
MGIALLYLIYVSVAPSSLVRASGTMLLPIPQSVKLLLALATTVILGFRSRTDTGQDFFYPRHVRV